MKKRIIPALLVSILASPLTAAEEPVEEPAEEQVEEPLWTGNLGLSYLATTGNTSTQTGGFNFKLDRRAVPWGLEFRATAQRAEDRSNLVAERYFMSAKALRALGERWSFFAGMSGEQDRFAGIESRFILVSGGRWNALVHAKHELDLGLGLTWTDEESAPEGDTDEYLGAAFDLDYRWKISETASFTQSFIYFPNFEQSEDWRMESETAIQARILTRLALRVSYEIRNRNEPINDLKSTDTTTRASVVLTF